MFKTQMARSTTGTGNLCELDRLQKGFSLLKNLCWSDTIVLDWTCHLVMQGKRLYRFCRCFCTQRGMARQRWITCDNAKAFVHSRSISILATMLSESPHSRSVGVRNPLQPPPTLNLCLHSLLCRTYRGRDRGAEEWAQSFKALDRWLY